VEADSDGRLSVSKYDPLRDYLKMSARVVVTMRQEEIAKLVGSLPNSASLYSAWWANEEAGSHVQAKAWLGAGYRAEPDLSRQLVTFRKCN
jgi:CelD/BcsL family acetyltransferase involved in cellulose biosynthesis